MAGNKTFARAVRAKNDEFYTQLADIESELRHYREQFRGKVVLCNCDDPYESNFFKFFAMNFNHLGLKKLITTSYTGSPITGEQLPVWDIEGMPPDTPAKPAYRVEISEAPDANCWEQRPLLGRCAPRPGQTGRHGADRGGSWPPPGTGGHFLAASPTGDPTAQGGRRNGTGAPEPVEYVIFSID